jgi:hypothetical protein
LLHRQKQAAEKAFLQEKHGNLALKNVRDFGIATSRKFILDAMAVQLSY